MWKVRTKNKKNKNRIWECQRGFGREWFSCEVFITFGERKGKLIINQKKKKGNEKETLLPSWKNGGLKMNKLDYHWLWNFGKLAQRGGAFPTLIYWFGQRFCFELSLSVQWPFCPCCRFFFIHVIPHIVLKYLCKYALSFEAT